jgi:hypothetical protein
VAAIPAAAVRRSPEGAFVYVAEVDQENKLRARRRPILPGLSQDSLVTVLSGISPTDRIIAEGSFKLRDGSLVTDQAQPPVAAQNEAKSQSDHSS